jgi:hypothetical protein
LQLTRLISPVVCLLAGLSTAEAGILTGASVWATTAAGGASNTVWTTRAPDAVWNVYFTGPNTGSAGAFINSGDTLAATALNVNLSAPGSYTFHFFADGGCCSTFYAMNLFFDGNLVNPSLSVLAGANGGTPTPNGAPNTWNINGLTLIPGANTLSFLDGANTITMTQFAFYHTTNTTVPTADRVQPFANTPNGALDSRGSFTLTVTAPSDVPEPSSWFLGGLGLAAMAILRRKP